MLSKQQFYVSPAHHPDDIIYEGSDAEETPEETQAKRRRYEEHAQRCIEGKLPILQSTNLRGLLNKENGWVNPWRWRPKELAGEAPHKPPNWWPLEFENMLFERENVVKRAADHGLGYLTPTAALAWCKDAANANALSGQRSRSNGGRTTGTFSNARNTNSHASQDSNVCEPGTSDANRIIEQSSHPRNYHNHQSRTETFHLEHNDAQAMGITPDGNTDYSGMRGTKRPGDAKWLKGSYISKRARWDSPAASSPTPIPCGERNRRRKRFASLTGSESPPRYPTFPPTSSSATQDDETQPQLGMSEAQRISRSRELSHKSIEFHDSSVSHIQVDQLQSMTNIDEFRNNFPDLKSHASHPSLKTRLNSKLWTTSIDLQLSSSHSESNHSTKLYPGNDPLPNTPRSSRHKSFSQMSTSISKLPSLPHGTSYKVSKSGITSIHDDSFITEVAPSLRDLNFSGDFHDTKEEMLDDNEDNDNEADNEDADHEGTQHGTEKGPPIGTPLEGSQLALDEEPGNLVERLPSDDFPGEAPEIIIEDFQNALSQNYESDSRNSTRSDSPQQSVDVDIGDVEGKLSSTSTLNPNQTPVVQRQSSWSEVATQSPWASINIDILLRSKDLIVRDPANKSPTAVNTESEEHAQDHTLSEFDAEEDVSWHEVTRPTTPVDNGIKPFKDFMTPTPSPEKRRLANQGRPTNTQLLEEAATNNPWAESSKKIKSNYRAKHVSFGIMPFKDEEDYQSKPPSSKQVPSSPPPQNMEHLRNEDTLDDDLPLLSTTFGKHFATVGKFKHILSRQNDSRPQSSPRISAMAEAFIAASNGNPSERSRSVNLVKSPSRRFGLKYDRTTREISRDDESQGWPDTPGRKTNMSNGQVTNVEDNFDDLLDDVGGYIEEWSVEDEIKKVAGNESSGSKDNGSTTCSRRLFGVLGNNRW